MLNRKYASFDMEVGLHITSDNQELHDGLTRSAVSEERLASILTGLFFLGLCVILALPLFSTDSWLVFLQDDFLYYLKVAQNIVGGHGSTFNGIVATNGYQPLWLLVLVGLSWFTSNPRAILAFLACSNLVAALATFAFARRLLAESGARPLLVFVCAAWTTLYATTLFFYGMEVTLTVPLMLGILCLVSNIAWVTKSWTHSFVFGLVLSAMVLSRIDTLIFGGLLLAGMLILPQVREMIRKDLVFGVLLGLLPVVLYFVLNRVFFHTWLPVSGMAKELKHGYGPSLEPWKVFFHPLAATFTLFILGALSLLMLMRRRFDSIHAVMFSATILFPFVYYLVLSCVSDWTLWGWYMYPIRSAICVSLVIFLSWPFLQRFLQRPLILGVLLTSVFACLVLLRWTRQQVDIYAASLEIREFAASHPSIYAMGDRAGRVGYLMNDPVIQTEGLMMDRTYLKYVEQQASLRDTLARYHVRYYIATAYVPFTGCFLASEPAKAGPASAKMHDVFCEKPQARYMHDGIETLIYDLQNR